MTVRTTCPYCGVGCGVLATPDGQGGLAIKGDPDHPANRGRLCVKGAALGETVATQGRLLTPRIAGAKATWDSALDLVADRFADAVAQHGPDSVAMYVSGQLLTEDYYVANKLMKGFIGSANIDTNSRLCMASSVAGHRRAFGSDTVPGLYEDLELADLVVLTGSNLAWCHPVLHQRLMAKKGYHDDASIAAAQKKTATDSVSLDDKTMDSLKMNLILSQVLNIQGTPATIIGDQMVAGAIPAEDLEGLVKEQLAKARGQ